MTPSELLVPRYKVIADYPKNPFKVGETLIVFKTVEDCERYTGPHNAMLDDACNLPKYPAIFQPIPWYAERELTDLPEYISVNNRIHKVEWYIDEMAKLFYRIEGVAGSFSASFYGEITPATLQDYQSFINKTSI